MIIPDETKYKEGDKRVEDMPGFKLCIHCIYCPMNTQNKIRPDGEWKCLYRQQWKTGNDLLEYLCWGYRQKACNVCKHYGKCDTIKEGIDPSRFFCNRFYGEFYRAHNMSGRVRMPSSKASFKTLRAEERYYEKRRKQFEEQYYNQGDRSPEDRQPEEV